jgi:hypothetical protein
LLLLPQLQLQQQQQCQQQPQQRAWWLLQLQELEPAELWSLPLLTWCLPLQLPQW